MTLEGMVVQVLREAWEKAMREGLHRHEGYFTYDALADAVEKRFGVEVNHHVLPHLVEKADKARKVHAMWFHDGRTRTAYQAHVDEEEAILGRDGVEGLEDFAVELQGLLERHGFKGVDVSVCDIEHRLEMSLPLTQARDFKGMLLRGFS